MGILTVTDELADSDVSRSEDTVSAVLVILAEHATALTLLPEPATPVH